MFALIVKRFYSSGSNVRVGFIGLGNMGGPMASNLIKGGYNVTVFDINPSNVDTLTRQGAKSASSPKEIATSCQYIVTMLPSSPHVKEVYSSPDGLVSLADKGTVLIDCSTIDPATSREMASLAEKKGLISVDAPVSGGVGGASAGTLTFMVGGSNEGFEKSKPLLSKMGKNIVHCGGNGNGQVAKICNNMLLGISMIATSEAMNLGVRMGMDPKVLAGIINTSSGRNWSSDTYNPCPGVIPTVPSSKGYEGGFGTALMSKDLGLAQKASQDSGSKTPLGDLANEIFKQLTEEGFAKKDFSVVYQWLSQNSKK